MKKEDNFTTYLSVILFVIFIIASLAFSSYKIRQNKLKAEYEAGYIAGYQDAINGNESKIDY